MEENLVLAISTWTLLSSVVLPILVGIVTKEVASRGLKAVVLAFLAAANGAVSSAIQNEGILSQATLSAAVISFVVAVASYYGFLQPTNISPTVNEKTSDFGVG